MPYTLAKGLAWILLALVLGLVIGWLLRSVAAKRQVARARSARVDATELDRLRARVAELEAGLPPASAPPTAPARPVAAGVDAGAAVEMVEVVEVVDVVDHAAGTPADPHAPPGESPPLGDELPDATQALGRPVHADDLQLVTGIGPKVEDLLHGIGICSWTELAATEVSLLRTMLSDAGPRFGTHDPTTWPEQARLLAAGRWDEFRAVADSVTAARGTD